MIVLKILLWILLAVLGIIVIVLILPIRGRSASSAKSCATRRSYGSFPCSPLRAEEF